MTEFWVSNAKHWCKICKVWTQGDKMSISKHEKGRGHQELVRESKKLLRETKQGAAREEADLAKQMREIEKAATAAVAQDLSSGNSKFSSAATLSSGLTGRYGGPPPPPRRVPPPPPRLGQPLTWNCQDCQKENPSAKAQCEKCGARKQVEREEKEGDGEDDTGIYTIGDVTYMDGKRHEHKLERNTFAQIWLENLEEWVDCVILSVQAVAVAHTDVVMRTLSAAYYTQQPTPPKALLSVEDFIAGEEGSVPSIVSGAPPDKFRLVMGATTKLPLKQEKEIVSQDENTGFGGWSTVSVVEVDEDEDAKKAERERVYLEKVNARKELEKKKDQERRDQEAELQFDGDDAMSTYDPWNKGVYKGVVLDPSAKSTSRVPPPPPSRVPPPPPPSVGGWIVQEERKRKLELEPVCRQANSLEVSSGSSTAPVVFKKRGKAKANKKFRSKQDDDE